MTTTKYQVLIEDSAENCDEILLDETFGDEASAQARYNELVAELADENGGWRDGISLWLFRDDESIDGTSK